MTYEEERLDQPNHLRLRPYNITLIRRVEVNTSGVDHI